MTLFVGSNKPVNLADTGTAVLGPARDMLTDKNAVRRAALAGRSAISGKVAPARSRRSIHPEIEPILQSLVYGGIAPAQVAAGTLDIGLSRLPIQRTEVHNRALVDKRVVVALPADPPLRRGRLRPSGGAGR